MSVPRGKAALFALGFGLVMTAVITRESLVANVPQTAVVFAAMGLPVNLDRLEIGPVQATLRHENDLRTLVVDGEIANPRGTSIAIPLLRYSIRDGSGTTLYAWTGAAGVKTLPPGGRIPIRARLTAPPAGQDVVVEFVRTAG